MIKLLIANTYSYQQFMIIIFCLVFQKSTPRLDEDETIAELATVALEHPSPISVLDGSEYRDDVPSPVKQISEDPKGMFSVF